MLRKQYSTVWLNTRLLLPRIGCGGKPEAFGPPEGYHGRKPLFIGYKATINGLHTYY